MTEMKRQETDKVMLNSIRAAVRDQQNKRPFSITGDSEFTETNHALNP